MVDSPSRHVEFEFVGNMRDLGGYVTREGRKVASRRLFRSAEPRHETPDHINELREAIGLTTVLDLRSEYEIKPERRDLFLESGVRYENVPFLGGSIEREEERELLDGFTNMGQFYLYLLRDDVYKDKVIRALEVIADPANHSVLFHCAVGKDRTGILSAFVYSILGVPDEDIIEDYALTAASMEAFIEGLKKDPKGWEMVAQLPGWMWEATPENMELFLAELQKEHGSLPGCLAARGADEKLFQKLRDALLE